ncbi:hypothetical protein SteCoe_28744 [Stentor coeruleus]|uniref:AMP-dependent synthetase/ligase domain-containing protein n=1 Tax=Stentor coeruleus TaxID=5963 RepID=A0A1R2B7J5_9CILI|nr:hypothetical protein SteCoe_28744 [Stentor coeruleus]
MGGTESSNQIDIPKYFIEEPNSNPHESSILWNVQHPYTYLKSPDSQITTMIEYYETLFSKHAYREMLGTRQGQEYIWKTYKQVYELALDFGSGIEYLDLCPEEFHDGFSVKFISIYSINREEWNIADIGCTLYKISNVPLYETLPNDHIDYIFMQTNLKTAILSINKLEKILKLRQENKNLGLKNIISIEDPTENQRLECLNLGLNLYSYNEILIIGSENRKNIGKCQPDDLYSISYSSGTTGNPKGIAITHGNMLASLAGASESLKQTSEDIHISYLPAAHVYEKVMSNIFYYCGGKIGFYSGDPQKLREDICVLRPTFLACVPRILNRFCELFRNSVSDEPENRRKVIQMMIDEKIKRLRKYGDPTHKVYDFLYFNKFKRYFGGRIRLGMSGAAPMNGQTLDFIKIFFGCNFLEAYGQTEVAGASTFSYRNDFRSGHIGGPIGCISIKLIDIPEMSYLASQNPPSGEICMKGPSAFPKYFKNPEITAEVYDSDGWLHTGDVAIIREGCLVIIDRKKSFLKLSQGEFVSPERVENIYMQCGFISFVFVYGDSFQNHLVGIVVPDKQQVEKEAKKLGLDKNWEELCRDNQICKFVIEKMLEIGGKLGLNHIEQVKRIYLHPVMITPDSGLLTPTFKMKRRELKDYFAKEIKELYEHEHQHRHTL